MARKRKKEVNKIIVDKKFSEIEFQPKCFGCKESYCVPELCGDWYLKCTKEKCDD